MNIKWTELTGEKIDKILMLFLVVRRLWHFDHDLSMNLLFFWKENIFLVMIVMISEGGAEKWWLDILDVFYGWTFSGYTDC